MKYARLIENTVVECINSNPNTLFNEIYASKFIEVPDEVQLNWTLVDNTWIPPIEPEIDYSEINKQKTLLLLQESDWVEYPSVSDSSRGIYLINISDWIDYRVSLRNLAVNTPSDKIIEFPIKPEEQWSK